MEAISKNNLKLAGELFCKCIELTTDTNVFSAQFEFTSYVQRYSLIIYLNNSNTMSIDNEFTGFSRCSDEQFTEWLNEMLAILIDEKSKSDVLNAPENIEATKQKLKDERIDRLKKKLIELEG